MSKKFLAIIFGTFIMVGGAFFFVLRWGSQLPPPPILTMTPGVPLPPPAPKPPSVTLTIQLFKKGNMLYVQWANLPDNTAALEIFRSDKGKNNWTLWKTITIPAGQLGNGTMSFNIGSASFSNYSFYIEAVNGGGGGGNNSGSSSNGNVLWTSSSTTATVTTSTPPTPPDNGGNGGPGNTSSTGGGQNPPPGNPTSTPGGGGGNNGGGKVSTSTPPQAGTPYYTPQLQISGYGQDQTGNFWVQHVDQKIEIGWQNIPPITTSIVVYRSPNQDGPWTEILNQENPGTSGAYNIQVVDNTLGQANYYEMNAIAGNSTIATYGPVYLPPVGQ